MDVATARPEPISVFAEMGSINPVFITPGAMNYCRDDIASALAASVTMGPGQFCTSPGLVVTLNNEQFGCQLANTLEQAPVGNLLHPSIASGLKQRLSSLTDKGPNSFSTSPVISTSIPPFEEAIMWGGAVIGKHQ